MFVLTVFETDPPPFVCDQAKRVFAPNILWRRRKPPIIPNFVLTSVVLGWNRVLGSGEANSSPFPGSALRSQTYFLFIGKKRASMVKFKIGHCIRFTILFGLILSLIR